ncbi:hypothetical protein CMI37_33705 [Candidatus Pacearchaeota archaeon]|nr:hypothetical protein [Candidatus Pacearchaeota archaeon]
MSAFLEQSFFVSFILLIWLQTEAFYEYCKLLGFKKIFKIKDYEDFLELSEGVSYIEYLNIKYDSFFTRLISCPICLTVWLQIFLTLYYGDFSLFFVKIWLTLVLYFVAVLLLKKSG